jgi:hypothetical protein
VIASNLTELSARLRDQGFEIEEHPHSVNAQAPGSALRIQFTTDERYQAFLARSVEAEVLGIRARVACLEDVVRGKLWAYGDPQRRKKHELDLIRLGEAERAPRAARTRVSGAAGPPNPVSPPYLLH